jgi:hypothetical protein
MCAPRISRESYRRITRPLVSPDGAFERRKIFAEARARFARAGMRGAPITWSRALTEAWGLAHRQIAFARHCDAAGGKPAAA